MCRIEIPRKTGTIIYNDAYPLSLLYGKVPADEYNEVTLFPALLLVFPMSCYSRAIRVGKVFGTIFLVISFFSTNRKSLQDFIALSV